MKAIVTRGSFGKPSNVRVAIVASQYHQEIVSRLVEGAKATCTDLGASSIDIFWVPGAFELPQAAQALAESGRYDSIVPLGCLIRGETMHFDYIARTVANGLDTVGR